MEAWIPILSSDHHLIVLKLSSKVVSTSPSCVLRLEEHRSALVVCSLDIVTLDSSNIGHQLLSHLADADIHLAEADCMHWDSKPGTVSPGLKLTQI